MSFMKKVYPLAHWWWIHWSNFRWRDVERYNEEIDEKYSHLSSIDDISKMTVEMYKNFKWTADNIDQLFDAICPPPYNYKRFSEGVLKDDCDGYHSLMYQVLHANSIECYLLSVVCWKYGHCILLFNFQNKWYTMDYNSVSKSFDSSKEAIESYDASYAKRCKVSSIDTNGLVEYNYKKGKFYNVSTKKLK